MRQRRLQLNKSSDKMPSPGDPRIRAYEAQRRIDQAAIALIPKLGIAGAYRAAMGIGSDKPVLNPSNQVEKQEVSDDSKELAGCDSQSAERFPATSRGTLPCPKFVQRPQPPSDQAQASLFGGK